MKQELMQPMGRQSPWSRGCGTRLAHGVAHQEGPETQHLVTEVTGALGTLTAGVPQPWEHSGDTKPHTNIYGHV